jgi:hypothetical protein
MKAAHGTLARVARERTTLLAVLRPQMTGLRPGRTAPFVPRLGLALALAMAGLSWTGQAAAAANDGPARDGIDRAFKSGDPKSATGNKKATAMLKMTQSLCSSKDACTDPVRAELLVAQGTLEVYAGKEADAKKSFAEALALDPNAKLRSGHDGPKVKDAFEAAKKGEPAPEPVPVPAPGPKPVAPAKDTRKTVESCESGAGQVPQGWSSYKAFCYFSEAVGAEAAQEWVNCADYSSRSADTEDRATTRYLGAQCSERGGRLVQALSGYQDVVRLALKEDKQKTAAEAGARAKFLRERIPKVVLQLPAGATNVQVWIDGEPADAEQVGGEMWVNPGKRLIEVKGKIEKDELDWRQTITISEGQKRVLEVSKGELDPVVQRCIEKATTPDQIENCLNPRGPSDFNVTVNTEFSGYVDTDAVEVMTPSIGIQAENAVDGWGVGASFLVDVVTAASVDIVATASPRWTEIRYVPSLNAHVKIGDADLGINGTVSVEPDYLAIGAGASLAVDFNQKNVTPSLRYDFGYDIQGRAGTPFDVFSTTIHRHGITGGVTFVINKSTIFVPGVTAVLEFGDTSKPYRYLPTFRPGTQLVKGESIDSVNRLRTPTRIADQLPDSRQRYALAGTIATRFTDVTLRLTERLYADSWSLFATTTDFLLPWDIIDGLRMWPHLRFHAQSGASFWELGYVVEERANDQGLVIPLLRTGDPELGPLLSGSGGIGSSIDITDNLILGLKGDVIYTQFLEHLFKTNRIGFFGAADLDIVFE